MLKSNKKKKLKNSNDSKHYSSNVKLIFGSGIVFEYCGDVNYPFVTVSNESVFAEGPMIWTQLALIYSNDILKQEEKRLYLCITQGQKYFKR